MDGNKTEHNLPESGQTAYGNARPVTSTTADTLQLMLVHLVLINRWTPTDATYDPATG